MAEFLGTPRVQYFDVTTGEPLVGGKLYSYDAGTMTPRPTYSTLADAQEGTNPNTNPVVLDARGEADVVIAGSTKLILKDANENTLWTVDAVGTSGGSVYDPFGNPILVLDYVENAVNRISITNASTGNPPILQVTGSDNNIDILVSAKGTGKFHITSGLKTDGLLEVGNGARIDGGDLYTKTGTGIQFYNTANTQFTKLKAKTDLATSTTFTLPIADGTANTTEFLKTDGVGQLSFGRAIPAGAVMYTAASTVPTGWLSCDGTNVSRTTYADLYAAIGVTFGSGDGSTTFGLPNQARRVVVGKGGSGTGTLGNAIGNTGGSETHTLSITEIPSHSHTYAAPQAATIGDFVTTAYGAAPAIAATGTAGGGGSHNNMQPSIVMNMIIKY